MTNQLVISLLLGAVCSQQIADVPLPKKKCPFGFAAPSDEQTEKVEESR